MILFLDVVSPCPQFVLLDNDKIIRPDMVVRMPDKRELVVDVKKPLDAYLEAV